MTEVANELRANNSPSFIGIPISRLPLYFGVFVGLGNTMSTKSVYSHQMTSEKQTKILIVY